MLKHFFKEVASFFEELFTKEETWFLLALAGLTGMILLPFLGLNDFLRAILYFLKLTWWLWAFLIVGPLFLDTWVHWRQEMFKAGLIPKWILLELRIPRQIEKSSKAMEQVLTAIHSLRNAPGDVREKYWDGEVTRWVTFEMVSFGGEIHFYVRCYGRLKNLVEAAFFSYYPGLDIVEVPDYIDRLPGKVYEMYEKGMDMWGTEMRLAKDAIYPIKTYTDFEHEAEEKNFDPISTFLEVLGKLKKNEIVGIQIMAAAAGSEDWDEKYEEDLKKLREPDTRKVKGRKMPQGGDEEMEMAIMRSPGQVDILKAVEENLSKPAFDTLIRFIYLTDKATFSDSFPRRGLVGAFNQYAALNLNSFKKNYGMETRARIWNKPYIFPNTRVEYRKARLLMNYLKRDVPPETSMGKLITSYLFNWNKSSKRFLMNTKCLATLFHVPTSVVLTEPHLKHLESKKAGPPSGLAIFGEEEELGKIQMTFLNNIYHGVINFPWEGLFYAIRTVIIILDVILLVGFVFAFWKAWQYRPDLIGSFRRKGDEAPEKSKSVFDVDKFKKHWKEILDKSVTAPPHSFTLAIVAADNLVGDALDNLGLEGDSIADKLGKLNPQEIKTLNNLWRAHRVRNDLVHTTGFEIKQSEAKEVLAIYESFLKEIGALQ